MRVNKSFKKGIAVALSMLMLLSAYAGPVMAAEQTKTGTIAGTMSAMSTDACKAGTITGTILSSVNLRKGPSTEFGVVVCLSKGDKVVVLSKVSSMYEVKATHNDKTYTGYVLGSMVDCPKASEIKERKEVEMPDQSANPLVGTTLYTTTTARLHAFASAVSDTIVSLPVNTPCLVQASGFDWYKVKATYKGKTYAGYVCGDYLRTASGSAPVNTVVGKTGYVNYDFLNVREKASTSSKKIGELYKTQAVTIVKKLTGWYKISYMKGSVKKTGYVSSRYISITTKGKINAKTNLRKTASAKSAKLATLKSGKKVTIIKESNGWVKIKVTINSKVIKGYVRARYINV